MPPKKTLDDQITFPLKASDKVKLKIIAVHYDRKPADMMRVILGDYLNQPAQQAILQAAHAQAHAVAVPPVPSAVEG